MPLIENSYIPQMDYEAISRQLVDGLNRQQADAVTTRHIGPLLVLAGAGCGKTLVLTRRIAFCAAMFCSQERILALTFTRKAATEMAQRLRKTPGMDLGKILPSVTTFHAFALRILRDVVDGRANFLRAGYRSEPMLIEDTVRMKLLAACSTPVERQLLGTDLAGLDALIDRSAVHPAKNAGMPEEKRRILDIVAARFRERKLGDGVWDFNDIMNGAKRLLDEDAVIRAHYASFFNVILVDEFQDTNPLQIAFLRDLGAQENRLFAVGDDDQSIYGFRGADITPIMTFDTSFHGSAIMKLETNYRSTQLILDTANRIFRHKPRLYRKVLRTGRYQPRRENGHPWPKPIQVRFASQEQMGAWIISTMEQTAAVNGIAINEMAILFRINQTLDWMGAYIRNVWGENGVHPQLHTIHGAKGLEFPVVFLCDLEEEVLPSYRRTKKSRVHSVREAIDWFFTGYRPIPQECDVEEEKRLFYVGVTRAEKWLFLCSCEKKDYFGRTMRFRRSRFLRLV